MSLDNSEVRHIVVAGNINQYECWLRENNFSRADYRYISDGNYIRGCDNIVIHEVGDHMNNAELKNFLFDYFHPQFFKVLVRDIYGNPIAIDDVSDESCEFIFGVDYVLDHNQHIVWL